MSFNVYKANIQNVSERKYREHREKVVARESSLR